MAFKQKPLAEQTIVITGATSGIGLVTSRMAAKRGARLMLVARNEKALKTLADELNKNGSEARYAVADVANESELKAAAANALAAFGGIDTWVNNAGVSADGLIVRITDDQWQRVLDVNLKGVSNCTKAVARPMMRARSGRIINLSSVVGVTGNTGQAAYAAAKAGIIGFTKSTARELASRGITANVVAPGIIETDMTEALDASTRDMYRAMVPLGRMGRGEDVAAAVTFLAGPGASYITGQVIHINGGMYV